MHPGVRIKNCRFPLGKETRPLLDGVPGEQGGARREHRRVEGSRGEQRGIDI